MGPADVGTWGDQSEPLSPPAPISVARATAQAMLASWPERYSGICLESLRSTASQRLLLSGLPVSNSILPRTHFARRPTAHVDHLKSAIPDNSAPTWAYPLRRPSRHALPFASLAPTALSNARIQRRYVPKSPPGINMPLICTLTDPRQRKSAIFSRRLVKYGRDGQEWRSHWARVLAHRSQQPLTRGGSLQQLLSAIGRARFQ